MSGVPPVLGQRLEPGVIFHSYTIMSLTFSQTLNGSPLVAKVQTLSWPFKMAQHLASAGLRSSLPSPPAPFPESRLPRREDPLSRACTVSLHRLFWLLLGSSL